MEVERIAAEQTPQPDTTMLVNGRVGGLDLWRAILLGYGVLVHASTASDSLGALWIRDLSAQARMEGFFFISGLLGAITISKTSPIIWLRQRLVILLIPLMFGLVLLNPLGIWMISHSSESDGFMGRYIDRTPISWHLHLWFLVCLLGFTFAAYTANRMKHLTDPIFGATTTPLSKPVYKLPVFASIVLTLVVARVTGNAIVNSINLGFSLFPLAVFLYYLLFYVIGFYCVTQPSVRQFILSPSVLAVSCAVVLLLGLLVLRAMPASIEVPPIIRIGCKAWIGLAACSLVLRHALSLRSTSKWAFRLSAAAFTVYLVHYDVVQAMLWLASNSGWSADVAFPITAALAAGFSLTFHEKIVRRLPIIAFLVNGRVKKSAKMA